MGENTVSLHDPDGGDHRINGLQIGIGHDPQDIAVINGGAAPQHQAAGPDPCQAEA
ncbi:hypothetical protein JCM17846_26210 [Iodidimonas nitroreducens]|uniref:Uncharacterized protein n=1 Tax=Iodidimonas nitroreducens TaxID=1236968 RepID=A0A5A7NCZ1_9PROT|nr:hypothetical protein JCM17846_26210 [Iodidimonas nitroreducens]